MLAALGLSNRTIVFVEWILARLAFRKVAVLQISVSSKEMFLVEFFFFFLRMGSIKDRLKIFSRASPKVFKETFMTIWNCLTRDQVFTRFP